MARPVKHLYEFGEFQLDADKRLLLRRGQPVTIAPKVYEVLLALVERRGQALTKDELLARVWPDTVVEESNLTVSVSALRKALGERRDEHRYIVTIPGSGYQFVAEVRERREEEPALVVERQTISQVVIEEELSSAELAPAANAAMAAGASELARAASGSRHLISQPGGVRARIGIMLALAGVAVIGGGIGLYKYFSAGRASPKSPPRVLPLTTYLGSESDPAFSPDGKQIAFVWNGEQEDNKDIYVRLVDVGQPVRLTTYPGPDHGPVWSPDGRHLAFLRSLPDAETLILIPSLGGSERKLGQFVGGPDWSPDGKALAVVERDLPERSGGVLLFFDETGERRQVTQPPLTFHDSQPKFSPDGKTLAFLRQISGGGEEIYLAPVEGGAPRQITSNSRRVHALAWSADGREIIFSSNRSGDNRLWRVAAAGGAPERIEAVGENIFEIAVTRDGARLAYVRFLQDSNIWRLALPSAQRNAQAGGNAPARFIASSREEDSPQFSPDGQKIAFASNRSGAPEIWVCQSDGSNPIQLTSFNGPQTGSPRWSPDGAQIAFDSRPAGHADIFVISAEGGPPRRLTEDAGADVLPSWSRDGRWVYFGSTRAQTRQIWKIPASGGAAVQVTRNGGFEAFESADGKYLFYTKSREEGGIWRLPLDGGEESLLAELSEVKRYRYWAMHSSGIYFIPETTAANYEVKFYSFATNQVIPIATLAGKPVYGPAGLAVSPDGRWLLYVQQDFSTTDIMLVENFR